jgi:hypothetical protein
LFEAHVELCQKALPPLLAGRCANKFRRFFGKLPAQRAEMELAIGEHGDSGFDQCDRAQDVPDHFFGYPAALWGRGDEHVRKREPGHRCSPEGPRVKVIRGSSHPRIE